MADTSNKTNIEVKKKKRFKIVEPDSDSDEDEILDKTATIALDGEIKLDLNNESVFTISQKYPPVTWETLFVKKAKEELRLISSILDRREKNDGPYLPEKINIFRAFDLCPSDKVNVVIFGQDPYHQVLYDGKSRAQGLAFSVSKEDEIPSSLANIFKEISSDLEIDNDFQHGDLTYWARQGILLLNTCLTVQPHLPKSHGKFWLSFVKKVIKYIATVNKDCIYVLWGAEAKSLKKFIEGDPPILEAAHPSGLSFSRGFKGCKHFSKINEILKKQGKPQIDWMLPC